MPERPAWRPDEPALPLGQGDLVLVAWTKSVAPEDARPGPTLPVLGQRDAFDLRLWEGAESPRILETWGRANYSLAVVITEGCGIDKEFNVLREQYLAAGLPAEEATAKALDEEEGYVALAEAWPVEFLPEHLRAGASSGAVGYLPFELGALAPADTRRWAVDVGRVATVRISSIHRRLGVAEPRWVLRLQAAICRYYAVRTIRVTEDLAEVFKEPVVGAEALTPPAGNPPRSRVRLHFASGRKLDLEGIVAERGDEEPSDARRSGFEGRDAR